VTTSDVKRASEQPEVTTDPTPRSRLRKIVDKVGAENLALVAALVLLVAAISTQTNRFFLPQNVLNIGQNMALVGVIAVGQTMVIVSRGLDISVGAMAGVTSVVAALVLANTGSVAMSVAAVIGVGLVLGAINAGIITVLRVNPVIATLATLSAYRGLAFLVAPDGRPIGVLDPSFRRIGAGRILATDAFPGIPIALIIMAVIAIAAHIVMKHTVFGRNIYAMGGNPDAARLSGVRLDRMKLAIYATSGALSGIGGLILTARTSSGQPASGSQGLELEVITAVFLGGAIMAGGKGTIGGTLLAVLLLGTLSNGMNLLGMPTFYQLVAKGMLLIIAVAIGQWRMARSERAQSAAAARA
jgi:ribose/xylose/arabinose/galactoside ABC-type transport system permease subunit